MNLFSKVLSAVLVSATLSQLALAAPGDFGRGGRGGRDRGDREDRGGRREEPARNQIDRQQARQLVRLMYRAILFREGEQSGVQGHAAYIEQHGARAVAEVAASIADSPEFRQNVLPRYAPRQIVQNVYAVFFNRPMDPSGRETWVPMVRQGRASQALRGIVQSEEFRRMHLR